MRRLLLAGVSILITLVVLEFVARGVDAARDWVYRPGTGYTRAINIALYKPHPHLIQMPRPDAVWKGTNPYGDHITISINPLGFRGQNISYEKPSGTYRIVTLGGSTTFGWNSDADTYPALLQDYLNEKAPPTIPNFEAVNAGVGGYTTAESLLNLSLRVLELHPDMIVIYHAYNDLQPSQAPDFKSDYSHWRSLPSSPHGLMEHVRLWVKLRPRLGLGPTPKERSAGTVEPLTEPPPQAVESFKNNLESMVGVARAQGIRVVLATYASFITPENFADYPDRLSYLERSLPNYSEDGMVTAMSSYNQAIGEVAQSMNVPLAPAASRVPPMPRYFYDHVHPNRDGNLLLAEAIGETVLGVLGGERP